MRNIRKLIILTIGTIVLMAGSASANPEIGKPAPDFKVVDMSGNMVSLSDYAGKPVILEWTNHQCPYVGKHYKSGNMQRLQRELTEDGVIWLSIISSAEGEQGHVSGEKAQSLTVSRGAYPTNVLLDPSGDIGHLYSARTTPHMFLIDEQGILQYKGGIDDKPSTRPSSLEGAKNYVRVAWNQLKNGEAVEVASTKPYGCSVHYDWSDF